jgi:hypothetical protein
MVWQGECTSHMLHMPAMIVALARTNAQCRCAAAFSEVLPTIMACRGV